MNMNTINKKHRVTLILTARQVKSILSHVKGYSITATASDWEKIFTWYIQKHT